MALPTKAILTYTAVATGGLSPAQLAANMAAVPLYQAPPADATFLPAGTSDAVFDVLFGANIQNDQTTINVGNVTRALTLGLVSSFVSLGNADPTSTATTNNPPYPAPVPPSPSTPAPTSLIWTGCIVSSRPSDLVGVAFQITFVDRFGSTGVETVNLNGQTPVNLTFGKYQILEVESVGMVTAFGQVNIWSGPVDEVTGMPTGVVVGYIPCSFFANFSMGQLKGWTPGQVADARQAYQLVPPDYNTPNQTVTATPPPSPGLLNYPPPSSVASLNPGATPNALLTPQPNFGTPNEYLSSVAGQPIVPNPFQGLWLGKFAAALNMPAARAPMPGAVSMSVTFA